MSFDEAAVPGKDGKEVSPGSVAVPSTYYLLEGNQAGSLDKVIDAGRCII